MAQHVHVEIDYEPGVGIPRTLNHAPGVVGKLVLHQTAETTFQALVTLLSELDKAGVSIDGPIDIHAEKEMQIGGDDGVTLVIEDGVTKYHITAPAPEEVS